MTPDQQHQVLRDTIHILETGLTTIGPTAAMLAAVAVLENAVKEIGDKSDTLFTEKRPGGWHYSWLNACGEHSWPGPYATEEGAVAAYYRRIQDLSK